MVFYFTATGNSLYVAKRLDDTPRSIPQCIHDDTMVYADAGNLHFYRTKKAENSGSHKKRQASAQDG